jgi:hypothetical protein
LLVGCDESHPSTYIKGPLGGEFDTSGLREFLEELSSPLPYAPSLFLFSSWLSSHVWSCARELEETPHTGCCRATGSPVQILLLPLLYWIGSGRSHSAPYVCDYYEVLHVRHYVGASVLSHWHHGVVALLLQDLHDLEVGYVVFIVNACAGA